MSGYPEDYYPPGYPRAGQPIPRHPARGHSQSVPQGHHQSGYPPQQPPSQYPPSPYSSYYPPDSHMPQSYGSAPRQSAYASTSQSQRYGDAYSAPPHAPDPPSQALIKHPGAKGHGNGGSGNRAGTEPSHRNKHSSSASHHKHSSRHHGENSGNTERQRRSTNTADTGGSHTRNDSGSIKLTLPGDGCFKLEGAGKSKVTFKNGPGGYDLGLEGSDAREMEHGKKKAIEPSGRTRDRKQRR